jgi:outer membrane protein OmpA-like peptidoglycan-associated protein
MSKTYTLIAAFISLAVCVSAQPNAPVQQNNFLVHITAFNEKRPASYFTELTDVFTKEDNKGIWHYFLGSYKTLEQADSVKRALVNLGYPYAYVIDVERVRRECKLTCDSDPSLDPTVPYMMRDIRSLTHLLYDFGKYSLKPESKMLLNRLGAVMKQNTKYTVELKGHTDAVGSQEANKVLSENRSGTASTYLQARGIPASRIKTSSYGMVNPIAKNTKDGKDCPEGRRFNRRVEIFIMDVEGNVLNALVEPLDIPTELLAETPKMKS